MSDPSQTPREDSAKAGRERKKRREKKKSDDESDSAAGHPFAHETPVRPAAQGAISNAKAVKDTPTPSALKSPSALKYKEGDSVAVTIHENGAATPSSVGMVMKVGVGVDVGVGVSVNVVRHGA